MIVLVNITDFVALTMKETGQPAQAALQSTAIREQGTLVHFTRLVLTPGPNLPQKDLHM